MRAVGIPNAIHSSCNVTLRELKLDAGNIELMPIPPIRSLLLWVKLTRAQFIHEIQAMQANQMQWQLPV